MKSLKSRLFKSLDYSDAVNSFLLSEYIDVLLDSIIYITPKVLLLIKSIHLANILKACFCLALGII